MGGAVLLPEKRAAELDRKLAAVREPRMQAELLREQLERLDAQAVFELLAHVLRRHTPGTPPAPDALRELLQALVLGEALAYERRAELYACASAADDERVMGLLRLRDSSATTVEASTDAHLDLRDVPLGRRRSLARGRDPLQLEKLARDPDPVVIANLLANPRTREDDVVRIAALRPVSAGTLYEIARCARWARQPRVRSALAQNPACPVELALRQLQALPRADLRAIESASALDPLLRAHARHELERRAGSGP